MSEQASGETLTCQIVPRDGRLPDLVALSRRIREAGDQFRFRGAEATVDGDLVRDGGTPAIRIPGAGTALRLAPLRKKVEWDAALRAEATPTRKEREAYQRLLSLWHGEPARARVVGPLVESEGSGPPVLEVREFCWKN